MTSIGRGWSAVGIKRTAEWSDFSIAGKVTVSTCLLVYGEVKTIGEIQVIGTSADIRPWMQWTSVWAASVCCGLVGAVVGCEDADLPANVWTERVDDDHMTVHCNSTQETWRLTCHDYRWISDTPLNCTATDTNGRPTARITSCGRR